jgi:hypothetical protein
MKFTLTAASLAGLYAPHRLGRSSGLALREAADNLPGDDIVANPMWQSTRAITIDVISTCGRDRAQGSGGRRAGRGRWRDPRHTTWRRPFPVNVIRASTDAQCRRAEVERDHAC